MQILDFSLRLWIWVDFWFICGLQKTIPLENFQPALRKIWYQWYPFIAVPYHCTSYCRVRVAFYTGFRNIFNEFERWKQSCPIILFINVMYWYIKSQNVHLPTGWAGPLKRFGEMSVTKDQVTKIRLSGKVRAAWKSAEGAWENWKRLQEGQTWESVLYQEEEALGRRQSSCLGCLGPFLKGCCDNKGTSAKKGRTTTRWTRSWAQEKGKKDLLVKTYLFCLFGLYPNRSRLLGLNLRTRLQQQPDNTGSQWMTN